MPSILGFVVKEALDSSGGHPQLDEKRCINRKQGRLPCSACVEICPGGAIEDAAKGKADWDKCISCGMCTVVCPAGALGYAEYRMSKTKKLLSDEKQVHVLGCAQAGAEADGRAWCTASFKWEQIAALALRGKVEILQGDCANCDRREKLVCFEKTLEQVRCFLGEDEFENRVILSRTGKGSTKEVSRRDLFGRLIPTMRKRHPDSAILDKDYGTDGLAMRRILIDVMKQGEPEREYVWKTPDFSDACWACGICAKVCPNEAIKQKEKDGVWRMVISPMKCTGCGICKAVCMDGGVGGMKEVKLTAGKRHVVHSVRAKRCPACSAAVKPDSGYELCQRCRAIQKNKK